MDIYNGKVSVFAVAATLLLSLHLLHGVGAWDSTYAVSHEGGPTFVPFDNSRHKREVPDASKAPPAATAVPGAGETPLVPQASQPSIDPTAQNAPQPPLDASVHPTASTDDSNRTTNASITPAVHVTQVPLLGENGTGTFKFGPSSKPKVSDPIFPDDNITTTNFEEQLEVINSQTNLTNLKYDNHIFYNSSFIGNETYFKEHWANITKPKADIHAVLSKSHRRATTLKLSFIFPFYGHPLNNITVATGGFLYTGEHVHNWLAATQYIAPLMANFDTTLTLDSCVKLYDDGEKFTALWENVNIREDKTKNFTFAVTLYKNGDIVFAYKDIPIPIQLINDNEHPVKVGISDAYQTDRMLFYVRRKTIYEYHRVSYKNHNITSNTLLRMVALPTCLQYESCESCATHETEFNCSWCENIRKCSSGTDRNKQDWLVRGCDRAQITNITQCPVHVNASEPGGAAYKTDSEPSGDAVVHTQPESIPSGQVRVITQPIPTPTAASPIGAAVSAFAAIALIASLGAWLLYAFKNPHTRSGQMLIKYRPSQWSWRRGEARYTAATIHM